MFLKKFKSLKVLPLSPAKSSILLWTSPKLSRSAYNSLSDQLKVFFTNLKASSSVTCEYGETKSYGKQGVLNSSSCLIANLNPNTTYYYRLTYNNNGKKYEKSGSINTSGIRIGEVVYLNPVTGKACYNYVPENSITGENSTCMKWYIISNDGDSVDLLLDHNTSGNIAWNSSGKSSDVMDVVLDRLSIDTSSWSNDISVRIISADDIANITGASSENSIKWSSEKPMVENYLVDENSPVDIETESSWFYFGRTGKSYSKNDNGWQLILTNIPGENKFSWLYNNTKDCFKYGCSVEDNEYYANSAGENSKITGYWTSTPVKGLDEYVWAVSNRGNLSVSKATTYGYLGVRPVVTVSKDAFIDSNAIINNIEDTTAPIVNVNVDSKNVELTFIENGSGMSSYCITTQIGTGSCVFNKFSDIYVKRQMDNYGTYYVYAKDVAGNISEAVSFSIVPDCIEGVYNTYSTISSDQVYCSGDAIVNYEGYNWHVVRDDGTNVTLLMDMSVGNGQIPNLSHCWENECYSTYKGSWANSIIRQYLNGEIYENYFSSTLKSKIIANNICTDEGIAQSDMFEGYGGYLSDEINSTNKFCTNYENDNVRLLTLSEYMNLTKNTDTVNGLDWIAKYDDILQIDDEVAKSWLYLENSNWWLSYYTTYVGSDGNTVASVDYDNSPILTDGENSLIVRPVITIRK